MTTEMTQNNVPDQHSSLVGGSTAARRMACPASYALEQKVPEAGSSKYAQEGTALHEMMTVLLSDPDKMPEDILPFAFTHVEGWSYTIDEDVWERLGQPALDAFLDYCEEVEAEMGAPLSYIVEQRCEFPGIVGAFGTADIVWRCGSLSGVWDWKFGHGPVKAEENAQLMFYACAAMATHPGFFDEGGGEIELAIMQPALSEKPDVWVTDRVGLSEFADELRAAVKEAEELGEEGRMEKGAHCKFARCKAVCPLHLNPAFDIAGKLAAIEERRRSTDTVVPLANEPEFRDDLPGLLELAETVKDFAAQVFGVAQGLAETDDEVRATLREAGWVLKDKKRGARKYVVDEKKVMNGARYRGLKIDDFAPRQLISPTQLEKALQKLGKELPDGWAEQPPSSGTTLTRQTGGVEEHRSNREKIAELGEKLAHLR